MTPDNNDEELKAAATRLVRDPFFMAFVLTKYKSELQLNDQQLAKGLSCSLNALTKLALCRAPRTDSPQLLSLDVRAISDYVACDPRELIKIVRTVQSFQNLQRFGEIADHQLLKAARDKRRRTSGKSPKPNKRKS